MEKEYRCEKCGKIISEDWYYKNNPKITHDYSYVGWCDLCEDVARYTGNL